MCILSEPGPPKMTWAVPRMPYYASIRLLNLRPIQFFFSLMIEKIDCLVVKRYMAQTQRRYLIMYRYEGRSEDMSPKHYLQRADDLLYIHICLRRPITWPIKSGGSMTPPPAPAPPPRFPPVSLNQASSTSIHRTMSNYSEVKEQGRGLWN